MVEDRGIGVEPRALEHLFQPFFTQFDPSRHSSGDFGFCKRGLGLGLSIAKQFVDMHGGRIFAESVESGGTRVTAILPRGPAWPKMIPAAGRARPTGRLPPPTSRRGRPESAAAADGRRRRPLAAIRRE